MKCLTAKEVVAQLGDLDSPVSRRSRRSFCLCQCKSLLVEPEQPMISCSSCNDWFHLSCLEMSQRVAKMKKSFKCPQCDETSSPARSLRSRRSAVKYSDDDDDDDDDGSVISSSAASSLRQSPRKSTRLGGKQPANHLSFSSDSELTDEDFMTASENEDMAAVKAKSETVLVRGQVKVLNGSATINDSNSSAGESSEAETVPTDDEERKMLEEEELQIRLNGMDTDEENNFQLPELSDLHGNHHDVNNIAASVVVKPIDDPNEIDHVWSSTDDEHYFDLQQAAAQSDGSPTKKSRISPQKEQQQPVHTHAAGKKGKCNHPSCRRKKTSSGDDSSTPLPIDFDNSTSIPPTAAATTATIRTTATTATLTPAMIQTYLAGRGVQISDQHAVKLSENFASGIYNLPISAITSDKRRKSPNDVSKFVSSAHGGIPSMSAPRIMNAIAEENPVISKEARQLEALHAQALGGYMSSMGNLLKSSSAINSGGGNQSSLSNQKGGEQQKQQPQPKSKSPNKERLEFITVDDLLQGSSAVVTAAEPSTSPAGGELNKLNQRWDKIPIGTFRRSRRISAPILKLSLAVRSTFGVVPQSIHETLSPADNRRRPCLRRPNSRNGLALVTDSEDEDYYNIVEYEGGDNCGCSTATASATELSASATSAMEDSASNGSCANSTSNEEEFSDSDTDVGYAASAFNATSGGRFVRRNHNSHDYFSGKMSSNSNTRFSLSTTDLSQLVEDNSHPPSACASPSSVPLMFQSPVLGLSSSSALLSTSMERLDIGPSSMLANIDEGLAAMENGFSPRGKQLSNTSGGKRGSAIRKRRRSSVCLNDILASFQ